MVPQNLSRPSRIGTGNCDHVFVCIYRNKDLQEAGGLCWKQGSGSICLSRFADCPTTETQVEKTLKGFCSGNIARQTRPFWAKVGSWHTRLSPTFREPFADFSPRKMVFKIHVSWEDGRVFLFNGCMNATVTDKHEYYIKSIYDSLIGIFRPFANPSPPFRGLSPLQQKYKCISADVTRILKVLHGF